MKRGAAALLCIVAVACTSAKKEDEPSTVPPPQPIAPNTPSVDARLGALETSMTELLDRLDVLNARIAKLESATPPAGGPPSPAATAKPARTDIPDTYRQALILLGEGKPGEAREKFQRVFDADPNGSLANNALFWIGETYYATHDYPNAMHYYQRVIREYPDQNKAPDATFKLGMAFVRTGDLKMAKQTFEQCIQKYPYSGPASSAKGELKRISY